MHRAHDEVGDAEDDAVLVERLGHGKRRDEHRRHDAEHRDPDDPLFGIERVRQPRVRGPGPPDGAEDEDPAKQAAPGRVGREHRRDLREPEDEDEVEEELERLDALVLLGCPPRRGRYRLLEASRMLATRRIGFWFHMSEVGDKMKTMAYLRPPADSTGRFLIALTLACCLTGGASATAGLQAGPETAATATPRAAPADACIAPASTDTASCA